MKKNIKKTAFLFTILFAIIQIVLLIYFFQSPQHSDQVVHVRLANQAYNAEVWYPSVMNLYDYFIVAPGLINFLTIQLHLFGTVDYNGFFQFIMNMIMLYEVFFIGKKLFSLTTGYISAILYCLLYSNYMGILVWGTEIPFLFLALSGVCLCLTDKWYNIFLAGLLFSVSNTIRPLVLLFVILVVVYFFIKKVKWSNYILLLVPFFILNFGYGKMNEHRIGYFVNQSTTGGTNLIQTAHDRAERFAGESKYPLKKMISFAFDGITSFSVKPVHFVLYLGLLFLLVSLGILGYVMYSLIFGNVVPGWSSIMLSMWFCSGCILTGLGMVGEYIGKIYIEVKERPRFNIEKVLMHKSE